MYKNGFEFVFIWGLLWSGFSQGVVYKCAGKAPGSALLYIAATDQAVNFHFTNDWGNLSKSMTELFAHLEVVPSGYFPKSFEFSLDRQNCELAKAGIGISCKRSKLLETTVPVIVNSQGTPQSFSVPLIRDGKVKLTKMHTAVGTIDYALDLYLETSFGKEGEISQLMECMK